MSQVKSSNEVTTEVGPLERLKAIDEERDAILAELRVERVGVRARMEELDGILGAELPTRVRRKRVPKVEGEPKAKRVRKGGLGSVVPDVLV